MASRRMFAKSIVEGDAFCFLSLEEQNLYFHLGMNADDDGVIDNAARLTRSYGFKESVLQSLIEKRFLLVVDRYVVVKHWHINNYIAKDRYKQSPHKDVLGALVVQDDGSYTEANKEERDTRKQEERDTREDRFQNVQEKEGKDKEGKDRLGKDIETNVSCSEPSVSEPPVITILTNSNEDYPVFSEDVNEWQELYPAVDVMSELRKMKGWSNRDNPKRKTAKGMRRFITSWLAREQDKGNANPVRAVKPKSFMEMLEDEP